MTVQSGQIERGPIGRVLAPLSLVLAAALLAILALSPPAQAQKRQFYGVNPQGPLTAADYGLMRAGRVGHVRVGIVWWKVERSPGGYDWRETDALIGNLAGRGISALPLVDHPPTSFVQNPPTRPADRQAFNRLMAALAKRYGPGGDYWRGAYQRQFPGAGPPRPVRTWQIFNEQNSFHHWAGRPSPRLYGLLVKAGAAGVRSQHRRAEIVIGGMFATPGGKKKGSLPSLRFLKRLYKVKGIKRAFNTVAVHPYAGTVRGMSRQMQRTRRVMRRNKHRAGKMRVTELGWGAARGRHALLKGPRGQAKILRKSLRRLALQRNRRRGWNVAGVSWWSWQDLPDGVAGCPFCHSSGLFSGPPGNRQARPAWRAFRQAVRR